MLFVLPLFELVHSAKSVMAADNSKRSSNLTSDDCYRVELIMIEPLSIVQRLMRQARAGPLKVNSHCAIAAAAIQSDFVAINQKSRGCQAG